MESLAQTMLSGVAPRRPARIIQSVLPIPCCVSDGKSFRLEVSNPTRVGSTNCPWEHESLSAPLHEQCRRPSTPPYTEGKNRIEPERGNFPHQHSWVQDNVLRDLQDI